MDSPHYVFEPAADDWVHVSGGDLEHPIAVQVRVSAHRARIVGLRISNQSEVTSAALRKLRLGRIATELLEYVRAEPTTLEDSLENSRWRWISIRESLLIETERLVSQGVPIPNGVAAASERSARMQVDDAQERWVHFQEWRNRVADASNDLDGRERGRGSKPPTTDELESFAKEYLRQAIEEPRGAVTRTAEQLHFDRATAYRWLKLCREATPPLIPPKDA